MNISLYVCCDNNVLSGFASCARISIAIGARQEEEDDRGNRVVLADHLVVGRGDPLEEPGRAGRVLVRRSLVKDGGPLGEKRHVAAPEADWALNQAWKAPGLTTRTLKSISA